jgi:hypothetical protein
MMNKKISKTIATALTMNPLLECFIVFSTKTLSFKPKEIEKLLPRWRMKLLVTGEFFLTFFYFPSLMLLISSSMPVICQRISETGITPAP